MSDLNIRNVDVTLVTSLKQEALRLGLTLRALCILKLGVESGIRSEVEGLDAVDAGAKVKRGRKRASVSVLQGGEGNAERLHSVQPLRDQLGQRGEHIEESVIAEVSGHERHNTYKTDFGRWCSTCKVSY